VSQRADEGSDVSGPKANVLVIDDRPNMLRLCETVLGLEHRVRGFTDPKAALEALEAEPADVVVSDVRMPGLTGLEVLDRITALGIGTRVVLMTAYGTTAQAVDAVKRGAFDYILKPFEPEALAVAVERALAHRRLEQRANALSRRAPPATRARSGLDRLVGQSPEMQAVRDLISRVAPSDATALITGPSGTGKELVARAIHDLSPRVEGPFVVVHCAAVPRELLESEVFGHVRGAFSGAGEAKRGMADEARGGTLFLDDVNYLDIDLQAKVNRLVQEREIKPVGATRWRRVDVRIVAAANVDLEAAIREGSFREDLYYRLNVLEISLPPLDTRREDIPELARFFIARHGPRFRRPDAALTTEALVRLEAASWPGNVRELENACERALILTQSASIGPEVLRLRTGTDRDTSARGAPPAVDLAQPYADYMARAADIAAKAYLEALLRKHRGNVTRAAKHADVARQHLHRLLKQHGIDPGYGRGR